MRLAQAKSFDSMLTSCVENPPKEGSYSCSGTHWAPTGADAVEDSPASHDAAPASDDPLPLEPPLVPELLPLAAPVLAPLPASEPLAFDAPALPLLLVPLAAPEPLPLMVPVLAPLVWPEPLPVLDPDSPPVTVFVPHPVEAAAAVATASTAHVVRAVISGTPSAIDDIRGRRSCKRHRRRASRRGVVGASYRATLALNAPGQMRGARRGRLR
jgi:hypothetical protein